MSNEFYFEGKASDLLHQLEDILDSDPLIDELGFIHPSQFSLLSKQSGNSHSSSEKSMHQSADRIASAMELVVDTSDQDERYFWNSDHKLGISTHLLLPLYKAAKHAFMTAVKQYKTLTNESSKVGGSSSAFSSHDHLESILMKHSRSLLLLSPDFMTAWNYRKLLVSKRKQPSMFIDELLLSALVLSYSPKSEQAWNQRQWVIRTISANASNFEEILRKESQLVEKIAERSKMSYRAWNYRSWLVSYMTTEQVLLELKESRSWAALHVADNSCFHYRKRLLLKIYEDKSCMEETISSGCNVDIDEVWKDELDWNETLIKHYVGREALWLHRRFLSVFWINHFLTDSHDASNRSKETFAMYHNLDSFLENELCLLHSSLTIVDNDYEDFQSQATHSASYILWLKSQVSKPLGTELLEKLREFDLKTLLGKSCPERSSLYNYIMT